MSNENTEETEEIVPELDPIEAKMLKLQFYWELLGADLFSTDDPLALEIEDEVRVFLRGRVEEVMGGGKTRGRKKQQVTPPVSLPVRVAAPRPARPISRARKNVSSPRAGRVGPSAVAGEIPKTATDTGIEIIHEVPTTEGGLIVKKYRKLVDNESGREYYLSFNENGESDGNKYTLIDGQNGNRIFRVISEQTLVGGATSKVLSATAINQQSMTHATTTLESVKRNQMLGGALAHFLK